MRKTDYKNYNWLYDQYIDQKKSIYKISEELNCSTTTILRWLEKFNIKTRSISEANKNRKLSDETKRKISETLQRDNVGYEGLHKRIRKKKPKPDFCELCGMIYDEKGSFKLELSNKDHKYTEKVNDYQYVHRSCHEHYDIKYNNKYKNA